MMQRNLVLASASPRRQALLRQVYIPFTVRVANIDEAQITTIDPVEKVKQLASLKGRKVELRNKDEIILSADTVVAFENQIFEKPKSKDEARQMMTNLSGTTHDVYTGVMIRSFEDEVVFVEKTEVTFWSLALEEIEWYINTDEPYDKAGGYGIQSLGAMYVKQIVGDYYNVVGLPLSKVVRELRNFRVFPRIVRKG